MFKENGALRTATSKFALKNALAKPRLSHQKADILIVDSSAQLWVTAWPGKGGLVSDLINTFRQFIARQGSHGQFNTIKLSILITKFN